MAIHKERITITTAADGSATVYSSAICGLLHALIYVPGTIDTGAGLTITDDVTGHALFADTSMGTSTLYKMPRGATQSVTDTGLVYAGTDIVADRIAIVGRVKAVMASGGNAKTGYLYVVWED